MHVMKRLIELIGVGLVAGLAVALALPVVAQDTFITGELILTEDMSSDSAKHLAPGPPEPWQYLSGAGTWAGVSPPTTIGTRTTELEIGTGAAWFEVLSVAATTPAATSDVILDGMMDIGELGTGETCGIRIVRDSTVLLSWIIGEGPEEVHPAVYVDLAPGAGTHSYSVEASRLSGTVCLVSPDGALSYMIAQVYE